MLAYPMFHTPSTPPQLPTPGGVSSPPGASTPGPAATSRARERSAPGPFAEPCENEELTSTIVDLGCGNTGIQRFDQRL